jgi:hypothetical protein
MRRRAKSPLMILPSVGLAGVLLLVAGCGAVGELASMVPSGGPTDSVGPPTATASEVPDFVYPDICALLPLGDVQGLSPFETPFERIFPHEQTNGCDYLSSIDALRPVRADMTMSGLPTADQALEEWQSQHDQPLDETTVTDIAGLGDAAFVTNDLVGFEAMVYVVHGRYYGTALFKGEFLDNIDPQATPQQRTDAAVATLRLLLSRLPTL